MAARLKTSGAAGPLGAADKPGVRLFRPGPVWCRRGERAAPEPVRAGVLLDVGRHDEDTIGLPQATRLAPYRCMSSGRAEVDDRHRKLLGHALRRAASDPPGVVDRKTGRGLPRTRRGCGATTATPEQSAALRQAAWPRKASSVSSHGSRARDRRMGRGAARWRSS